MDCSAPQFFPTAPMKPMRSRLPWCMAAARRNLARPVGILADLPGPRKNPHRARLPAAGAPVKPALRPAVHHHHRQKSSAIPRRREHHLFARCPAKVKAGDRILLSDRPHRTPRRKKKKTRGQEVICRGPSMAERSASHQGHQSPPASRLPRSSTDAQRPAKICASHWPHNVDFIAAQLCPPPRKGRLARPKALIRRAKKGYRRSSPKLEKARKPSKILEGILARRSRMACDGRARRPRAL